ncbi:MAG: serine/threonine-protein kinase [Acidobacteriota bacterium]
MNPDRLRRIAEVLEMCLEFDPALRKQYLQQLGRSDRDLQSRVEALLQDLEAREPKAPGATRADAPPPVAGGVSDPEKIGAYRVVRWLGMGGMGTVYLAERADEEFERQVAVKVIRLGFGDVPEVRKRFLSERQILATFEHPNIARMYEGGTTHDGHPFLVMEYVEGLPIDRYCDEHRLPIRERLKLFRQVCSAVEYAHRNLVVHRDLKPSNVLVTEDGTPKLLDFGIAKLLDPDEFPLTVDFTETGGGPLTPNYASPEQIRGERVTTSSDVYALGVLLYKLLTGRLPFDRAKKSREALAEQAAVVSPTRPSLVIGAEGNRPSDSDGESERTGTESSLWSTDSSSHRRQLAGDLDNIVLMAIRPEPERRYGSAEQLAEDLSRHLEGLPVAARDAGTWYRVSRFVRRNRLPVFFAASALALTLAFLSVTLRQNQQIRAQADSLRAQAIDLEASNATARSQTARAVEIADFFVALFEELTPENARGEEVSGRDLLDIAADKLSTSPPGDPSVQARLLTTIGEIYTHVTDVTAARELLTQAVQEAETLGGEVLADALLSLAEVSGDADACEQARRSVEITRGDPEMGTLRVDALNVAGLRCRPFETKVRHHEKALEEARQLGYPNGESEALNNLAIAYFYVDSGKATRLMEEAVHVTVTKLDAEYPGLESSLSSLATFYQMRGLLEEARPHHTRALDLAIKLYGPSSSSVAVRHSNLSQFHNLLGEYAQGEEHGAMALKILTEAEAGVSSRFALVNLAHSQAQQGRFQEALKTLERCLEVTRDATPNASLSALTGLVRIYAAQNDLTSLERWFARVEEIAQQDQEKGGRFSLRFHSEALLHRGSLYRESDPLKAQSLWTEALDLSQTESETTSIYTVQIRLMLKLNLGMHDEIAGELEFLRKSGAKDRKLERFCARPAAPAICTELEDLFPPDPSIRAT